jgi:hypothetical protein
MYNLDPKYAMLTYVPDEHTRMYRWETSFGRMGTLDGVFFDDCRLVQHLANVHVHFGEVLGKHSDIGYMFDPEDFEEIELDVATRTMLYNKLTQSVAGYNPIATYLEHLSERDDETGMRTLIKNGFVTENIFS